ncbi:MAG TPA: phage antirepressor KilAC domain-containing protein [Bacteroidales bacterium]|nr:phage antirepressor KilAC domain-containing protein [Bacteroidales bacterium]
MTPVLVFRNEKFGEVRTSNDETNNPWFCLADLCRILDLANSRAVRSRLNEKGVITIDTLTPGGPQQLTYVDEPNLYKVIFQSRKQEAEIFTEWVTGEVLPSIRKNGIYALNNISRKDLAKMLLEAEEAKEALIEKTRQQQKALHEAAPKVLFADAVKASESSILVGELAKILKQNGINIGQNRLFRWLRMNGYLCSRGESYNQPTQRAMELGLFEIKKSSITQPDGTVFVTVTTKVSAKGQIYFVNKFLTAA